MRKSKIMKILLLEKNDTVANVIQRAIKSSNNNMDVVFTKDNEAVLEYLKNGKYDAVIAQSDLDNVASQENLKLLQEAKQINNKLPFIVIADNPSVEGVINAFRKGATDVIARYSGKCVVNDICDSLNRLLYQNRIRGYKNLSKREQEIVSYLLDGLTNQQIADRLNIMEVTVKCHLTRIYKKLNVKRRSELIAKFLLSNTGGEYEKNC